MTSILPDAAAGFARKFILEHRMFPERITTDLATEIQSLGKAIQPQFLRSDN